ncbi:MAG: cupin domain-containing protein [Flavobacteriaceae bacterium]
MAHNIEDLEAREYFPGFLGKMIHTQHMTIAFWEVTAGAEVPEHAHHHEQVLHVLEGRFEFTLNGHTSTYESGDLVVIPPNAVHSGIARTACKLMDVFSPAREDYKR